MIMPELSELTMIYISWFELQGTGCSLDIVLIEKNAIFNEHTVAADLLEIETALNERTEAMNISYLKCYHFFSKVTV